MKKNNTVVLTTIFEQPSAYVDDFLLSLTRQTNKQFDLLFINDGFAGIGEIIKQYPELNIIEFTGAGNIAKNRELLINNAIMLGYAKAIFADFDDYFSANRVMVLDSLLNTYDVVVNDLDIVAGNNIVCKKYFSSELNDRQDIFLESIVESNFFGLSNTALRLSNVDQVVFSEKLKAVDWFFFSTVLLAGAKATFTNQCTTYYRQHESNIANIGRITVPQLLNEIEVKKTHYSLMVESSKIYEPLLAGVLDFCQQLDHPSFIGNYYTHVAQQSRPPFWWNIFNINYYWRIKNEINRQS